MELHCSKPIKDDKNAASIKDGKVYGKRNVNQIHKIIDYSPDSRKIFGKCFVTFISNRSEWQMDSVLGPQEENMSYWCSFPE